MENNLENNTNNNENLKFGLPKGYFQKSTSSILNKIEWIDEHKEFPNLIKVKNKTGFIVPENYFSKADLKLELIEFEKLNSIKKNKPFTVPENYFEEDILKLIIVSEEVSEQNNYPILTSHKNQTNFIVPEKYFINNEQKLIGLQTKLPNNKAKVINLFSQKMWYSVAALLLVAVCLWMYNSYYKTTEEKDCGTLACVDKADLVKAKHLESIETEELYKLVNTKKLEDNLEKKSNQQLNKYSGLDTVLTDDLLDEL